MTKREPWQDPPVHPAAALLPMMSDAELEALAADIKANGLQQPIVVWEDNTEAAEGGEGPFPTYLLDGRNRLAAMQLLGIKDPRHAPRAKATQYRPGWSVRSLSALVKTIDFTSRGMSKPKWRPGVNPTTFVLSMNVHRRHLTSEQKRQAIAAFIKADPTTSDRTVAKELGVDNKTAAKVRATWRHVRKFLTSPTRTDSAGRKQPATKRKPTPKPEATAKPEPKPTPPGGITEDTPGMTPAVEKALADAKAKATQIAQQGEEPDQEPVEDVSDIDAMVDQALADARTAPASQEEEPKPVPEWSAAEKVAKFRLIWNWQEDEEEPEEVEDICVENLEFYRRAGRAKDLFDGLLRYEQLPRTAWTGRKREFGEIKYYDLIIDAVIMQFGVDTVAERLHHYQEATKEESQS